MLMSMAPGQGVEELPQDGDVLGVEVAGGLGGRGDRQHGLQGVPGEGVAGAQVGGVAEPAGGFRGWTGPGGWPARW